MAKQPTGVIVPPLLGVDGGAHPLYLQIYRRIRSAILTGALAPGDRLPSARTFATDLGVSRNTVEAAFSHLEAEGFLERRVGAGSFVARSLPDHPRRPVGGPHPTRPTPPAVGAEALSARGRLVASAGAPLDSCSGRAFGPCQPSLSEFPMDVWCRLSARRLRTSAAELLDRAPAAGYRPLREAVAEYLATARGVRCGWRQVVIVTSSQQAMELVARLVLDPGDEAWLEDPGYLGMRAALVNAGARIVPVPVDAQGLDVHAGLRLAPRARLAYVTPSHQYPLGTTMSLTRRLALLDWARGADAWVLEDDYDAEFRYVGRPVAAVQGLDAAGRVLYTGTFNKVVFPGLRLAYLVVPEGLVDAFAAARALVDGHAPTMSQAVLADFIAGGHFTVHLRHMRAIYRERRDVLIDALARELGDRVHVLASDTGMHVTACVDARVDDRVLSADAAAAGLDLPPLSRYYIGPPDRAGVVVNFGAAQPVEIRSGIRTFGSVVRRRVRRSATAS